MGDRQREEDKQRAQAWYAILGLGALVGGAMVIMQWVPDNPFRSLSSLPNTSRVNSQALTGQDTPFLVAPPSTLEGVGPGCRVGDVGLVREHRDPLRRTVLQHLVALDARSRITPRGWTAGSPEDRRTDAGSPGGCPVAFAWDDTRGPHRALWWVSEDRQTVTPANDEARALGALDSLDARPPRRRERPRSEN
jgi:hypothetical protein